MTHLILYGVLALITYMEYAILVDEWRTTKNPGGLTLAEYLAELKREHRTEFRMAIAAGVYPFAIRKAQERIARQKAAAK